MWELTFSFKLIPKFLLFPLFYCLTPFLIILLKVLKLLRPSSPFVGSQVKIASTGESLFESTPQVMLQVYIILDNLYPPSLTQVLSIFSSAMTLSYLNIETYLLSYDKYSFPNILKCFPLFLLASSFRVITIALAGVMVNGAGAFLIGVAYVVLLYIISRILNKIYNLKSEENWQSQRSEFCILSFLTMTNLANSKMASIFRFISFYFITSTNLLIITIWQLICNIDPSGYWIPTFPPIDGTSIIWRLVVFIQHKRS